MAFMHRFGRVRRFQRPAEIWYGYCNIEDFQTDRILGTGSYGRVQIARYIRTGQVCAIKALSKAQILREKQRFYAAQVLLSFEYLHSRNIIYRDLKPENLLLDEMGYIKVADFGFAKVVDRRTFTLCGTPDYLAPEILLNKGHGKPVDWWTFGVLVYEMLAGFTPFQDSDTFGTYQKILKCKLRFPTHFSYNARDLINKLLTPDLTKRIGCLKGGVRDIKSHPFFEHVDWDWLLQKRETPPYKPICNGKEDVSNFEDYSHLGPMKHAFELTAKDQEVFEYI
ncbi:cAMP-dependent protein kinase type 1-like [Cryptomeria japonica]|uniref:cAMP-dependent protein kinase type 1-like n=1 Tax=Cryptomeria japonica TaxID=3369 RepID=UPI0027DA4304|nr:cAMP-dependent protein kinase type 1-like [Cryptomeria japonica]